MHKIHILLILLLFFIPFTTAGNKLSINNNDVQAPLYIIDGKIGVNPAEFPPTDEIASTTILADKEAVELYGERAKNGVIVVKTKEFVKTHGGGDKTRYDSNAPKRHKKGTPGKLGRWINKITGGNTFLGIILCLIIVFAIMTMPTIVPKLLYRKNSKKGNKRASSNYDPGTFDAEGVRFNAVSQLKNYLLLIFCIIIICMFIVIIFKHIPNMSSVTSIMITLAYFGAMITLFLILFVAQYSKLKSYIIVDEKGLRGILPRESKHFTLKPTFKNVNISWEDIKRAQMDGDVVTFFKKGTKIPDDMVDFAELADTDITEEEIEKSIYEIDLLAFPVNKVRDSINYFYARKNGIAKQPSLIKPDPSEKTNVLTIILIILAVLLLSYLAK